MWGKYQPTVYHMTQHVISSCCCHLRKHCCLAFYGECWYVYSDRYVTNGQLCELKCGKVRFQKVRHISCAQLEGQDQSGATCWWRFPAFVSRFGILWCSNPSSTLLFSLCQMAKDMSPIFVQVRSFGISLLLLGHPGLISSEPGMISWRFHLCCVRILQFWLRM